MALSEGRIAAPAILAGERLHPGAEVAAGAAAIRDAVAGHARVALLPPSTPEGVAALLGLLGAPVTALIVHPRWSAREAADAIRRSGSTLLLHGSGQPPALPGLSACDLRALAPRAGAVLPDPGPGELVLSTSGTTGRPGLVRLPAASLLASAAAWKSFLPPATAWLLSLGLGHVAGIGIVLRAALAGVPLVLPADGASLPDAAEAARAAGIGLSHASLVPTQLARLLEAGAGVPAELRALLLGGGPIDPALLRRALAAGWPAIPTYGLTEAASGVTAALPGEAGADPESAGRPLPGMEVRIGDPADPARILPDGSEGEIQVRGASLAAGLLDEPERWAARRTADGFLRTGDLGLRTAAGALRVIGRIDDLIVRNGENIAPAEVEAVLAAVPGVREVAVVGVPDPVAGARPVAAVVSGAGADPSDADLLAAAAAALAPFRVPARIVRLATLPRGAGEKLLRRELRAPLAAAVARALPDPADGPEPRIVLADDGAALLVRAAPRITGDHRPGIVYLHATLATSAALLPLAAAGAEVGRPLLLDRRGSGGSRLDLPAAVPLGRHVADLLGILDALGEERPLLVGHSFGGVVALAFASLHPERTAGVLAWEPPWLPFAPEPDRERLLSVGDTVADAHRAGGAPAAAAAFLGVVAPELAGRIDPARHPALVAEGDGVLADAAAAADPGIALDAIRVPVLLASGGASEPWYGPIVARLAAAIPGARTVVLPGLRHAAPSSRPDAVAPLIHDLAARTPGAGSTPQPAETPR